MRYRDTKRKPKAADKNTVKQYRYDLMLLHPTPNLEVKSWNGLNDSPYAPKKAVE